MAALGSQSIASSYEQLLHVDADGGGNTTTHVSVKDGDNGTTFGFTIATDALMMTGTNRLEFGDTGTYIHQSANGVLDLVSDTEIELNGTIDINGAVTMDGGNVTINDDSGDYDFRVESNGNANMLFVDGGNDRVGINDSTPAATLTVKSTANTYAGGFRIEGTDETTALGITHVDGSNFISGNATDDHMVINSDGAVTMPVQPAFLAHPASAQTNIAADNSAVTIVYGTEIFDQGGDFASNTFTAPVTGKYQFNVLIRLENVDTASTYYQIILKTSNREIEIYTFDPDNLDQDAVYYTITGSVLADMDASDTTYVQIYQASGTAQTDVATGSYFSGFLAC